MIQSTCYLYTLRTYYEPVPLQVALGPAAASAQVTAQVRMKAGVTQQSHTPCLYVFGFKESIQRCQKGTAK